MNDEADLSPVPDLDVIDENVVISWFDKDRYIDDVTLPFDVCATLLDIIDRYGRNQAYAVALAILQMTHGHVGLSSVETHRIKQCLWALDINRAQIAARDEIFAEYSYRALRDRRWTREEAAEFASSILNKPMSTDAWRKRVDRWAESHNQPPLGQTKRRSRKLSGQDDDK